MTHDRDEVKADYMDATIAALGGEWGQLHTGHIVRSMADEIVRLRKENDIVVSMMVDQIPLLNQLQDTLAAVEAERDRADRILAALREPWDILDSVHNQIDFTAGFTLSQIIRAAVDAAEQEEGA
jgi:hypothetical protein